MSESVAFATAAFGGFEKKQVLDYIYKMHEEIEADHEKSRKKLEGISVAFKELENRTLISEQEIVRLNEKLTAARSTIENKDKERATILLEKNEQEIKLRQYERILSQRKLQDAVPEVAVGEPSADLAAQKQELSKKRRELEETSARIGRVMLEAHNKAETIIANSNKEGARLIKEAQSVITQQQAQHQQLLKQKEEELKMQAQRLKDKAISAANVSISVAYDSAKKMMIEVVSATQVANAQLKTLNQQVVALQSSSDEFSRQFASVPPAPPSSPISTPATVTIPDPSFSDDLSLDKNLSPLDDYSFLDDIFSPDPVGVSPPPLNLQPDYQTAAIPEISLKDIRLPPTAAVDTPYSGTTVPDYSAKSPIFGSGSSDTNYNSLTLEELKSITASYPESSTAAETTSQPYAPPIVPVTETTRATTSLDDILYSNLGNPSFNPTDEPPDDAEIPLPSLDPPYTGE